jgi:hypothetical protein
MLDGSDSGQTLIRRTGLEARDWVDMNDNLDTKELLDGTVLTLSGKRFNSSRSAIKCNADAIASFLQDCKDQNVNVTIISHSKGGQDVLHALVDQTAGDRNETPDRRGLWDTVAGWVAFTSNFFEAEFLIEGVGDTFGCNMVDKPSPPSCSGRRLSGCSDDDLPKPCPNGDSATSLYSDFPPSDDPKLYHLQPRAGELGEIRLRKRRSRKRIDYMRAHKTEILDLVKAVPTLSLWASYVPVSQNGFGSKENGSLNKKNRGIREEAIKASADRPAGQARIAGANDGLVPARAGKLPGAAIRRKLPDASAKSRCGVDHLAPANLNPLGQDKFFWGDNFRNARTLDYIMEVEALSSSDCPTEVPVEIEVEIDIKPGGTPNSINCNNPTGVIPVAILSTDSFDATTVDHTTVTFEGASETHVDKGTGLPRRHEEDVNGDGRTDLVFHFRLGDADLGCGSTEARLEGETFDGQRIFGVDSVRMIDAGNGNRGAGGDEGGNGHGKGGNLDKRNNGNKGDNDNSQDKGNKGGNGKGKGKSQDQ